MSKSFNAVEFMRKRRAQIDEEDRGLGWKQKARKTVESLQDDPLWKRLRSRVVEAGRRLGASTESLVEPRKKRSVAARRRSR